MLSVCGLSLARLSGTFSGIVLIGQVDHLSCPGVFRKVTQLCIFYWPTNTEVKNFSAYAQGEQFHSNEWATILDPVGLIQRWVGLRKLSHRLYATH